MTDFVQISSGQFISLAAIAAISPADQEHEPELLLRGGPVLFISREDAEKLLTRVRHASAGAILARRRAWRLRRSRIV